MSAHLSRELIARALAEHDLRILTARAGLAKSLFAVSCRLDETLPVHPGELSWGDLLSALPRDLSQFEARLRRLELAVFAAVTAFELVQVREGQKIQMLDAAKRARP